MTEIANARVAALLDLLEVQNQGQGTFTGPPAQDAGARSRVFGGQVLAQALAAASFTVPDDRPCHSLHAYFMRPGKPGRPIEFEVSAMHDGKHFVARKVAAVQRNELICELTASFTDDTHGPNHQVRMPDTPLPETFPGEEERLASILALAAPELREPLEQQLRQSAIELIHVEPHAFGQPGQSSAPLRRWMRVRAPLPDHAALQRCVLAYVSDGGALEPSLRAVGGSFGDPSWELASLDHAVWFHRPFRCDDWLLCVFDSSSVAAGRGLNRGQVFTRDGVLVASIAQEALVRTREPNSVY
jgi:acyl-CoA thioesterase-2